MKSLLFLNMKGTDNDFLLDQFLIRSLKIYLGPFVKFLVKSLVRTLVSEFSKSPSSPVSDNPKYLISILILLHLPGDEWPAWPVFSRDPISYLVRILLNLMFHIDNFPNSNPLLEALTTNSYLWIFIQTWAQFYTEVSFPLLK